jgi:DNA-binding HxlR family transcriptional regulator
MNPMHDRLLDDTSNCPIALTLEIVGERWTLLILRESLYGVRRFDDFRRVLKCASNILTARLALLVENGILAVEPYQEVGQRARHEYVLTDMGAELIPVITALLQWGDRHYPDPRGPVAVVTHLGCGGDVSVHLRCSHGHDIADPAEATVTHGPGARRKQPVADSNVGAISEVPTSPGR